MHTALLCRPHGQMLPVSVYEGVESEAISPAGGEILNVHLRVSGA